MGTVQESVQEKEAGAERLPVAALSPSHPRQNLPAKGSCWYCEKPVDSVRRFCGKECKDAFDEEAEFTADELLKPAP